MYNLCHLINFKHMYTVKICSGKLFKNYFTSAYLYTYKYVH